MYRKPTIVAMDLEGVLVPDKDGGTLHDLHGGDINVFRCIDKP